MTSETAALQHGGFLGVGGARGGISRHCEHWRVTIFRTAATNAVCSTSAPVGTRPHWAPDSRSQAINVNGDIAIQWEWSKFDSAQNLNPLTNYDKNLHNWLRPRDEPVTQNLCQSTVRECLAKYVKYKASFFHFNLSRTRLLKSPVNGLWRTKKVICSAVHWHLGNVMLRNTSFFDICCFWCVMKPLTSV